MSYKRKKYITYRHFKGKTLEGGYMDIPVGTELMELGEYIATKGNVILCTKHSENGKHFFARNDDGRGYERGMLTYAIAYQDRRLGTGCRFMEWERILLTEEYKRFLRDDCDTILFNDDFFYADTEQLANLACKLNMQKDYVDMSDTSITQNLAV